MKEYNVTVEDFSKMLNINFRTAYNWIKDKKYKIPFYKLGGVWRANKEDIEKWIKSQTDNNRGD